MSLALPGAAAATVGGALSPGGGASLTAPGDATCFAGFAVFACLPLRPESSCLPLAGRDGSR